MQIPPEYLEQMEQARREGFREGILCYLGFLRMIGKDNFAADLQHAVLNVRISRTVQLSAETIYQHYRKFVPHEASKHGKDQTSETPHSNSPKDDDQKEKVSGD